MISIGVKEMLNEVLSEDGRYKYNKRLLITPHIKVDGRWEVFKRKEEFDLGPLRIDDFNTVICKVRDKLLTLTIRNEKGDSVLKDYKWNLPSNFRANYIEEDRKGYKESDSFFGDSTKVIFHNSFGMIGFRAYGDEHVIIKDIAIWKLY